MNMQEFGIILGGVMFVLSLLVFPGGIDIAVLQSENPYKEQLGVYAHQIDDLLIIFSGFLFGASLLWLISESKSKHSITSGEGGNQK